MSTADPLLASPAAALTESPSATPKPYLSIVPPAGWVPLDLPELWRFRELFWIFADRDIKVRYKQTVLGFAWALIQPLALPCSAPSSSESLAGPAPTAFDPHSSSTSSANFLDAVQHRPANQRDVARRCSEHDQKDLFPAPSPTRQCRRRQPGRFPRPARHRGPDPSRPPAHPPRAGFLPPVQVLLLPVAAAWAFAAAWPSACPSQPSTSNTATSAT